MIFRPRDLFTALAKGGPYRAGGVGCDQMAYRARAGTDVIDLRDVPGLSGIRTTDDALVLGALTPLERLVDDPRVRARWPGLAEAAEHIATPGVRALATVGGNLLQPPRCEHDSGCPTRRARPDRAVCFDAGNACAAPHPSTLAVALACLGASAHVAGRGGSLSVRPIGELVGAPLALGEIVTALVVPGPAPGERSHYRRVSRRERADWPLVEVCARTWDGAASPEAVVVVGGVASTPILIPASGDPAGARRLVVGHPRGGSGPEGASYKARLLRTLVTDTMAAIRIGDED